MFDQKAAAFFTGTETRRGFDLGREIVADHLNFVRFGLTRPEPGGSIGRYPMRLPCLRIPYFVTAVRLKFFEN